MPSILEVKAMPLPQRVAFWQRLEHERKHGEPDEACLVCLLDHDSYCGCSDLVAGLVLPAVLAAPGVAQLLVAAPGPSRNQTQEGASNGG